MLPAEQLEKRSAGPVPQTAGEKMATFVEHNMVSQNCHKNNRVARRAPYTAEALDEPAQVLVIHVDGEFAKACPKTSAEAAAVGPAG